MLYERAHGGASRDAVGGVETAIRTHRTVRAFSSRPVSTDDAAEIVRAAARAATGHDPQRRVRILGRSAIDRLAEMVRRGDARDDEHRSEPDMTVPGNVYDLRSVRAGDWRLLPIAPDRPCGFFGAPVGLVVTIEGADPSSHRLLGMFVQNVLLIAAERGLAGTVQDPTPPCERAMRLVGGIAAHERLACGVALGHEDRAAPENRALPAPAHAAADWMSVVR